MIAALLLLAVGANAGEVRPLDAVISRPALGQSASAAAIAGVSLPVLPSAMAGAPPVFASPSAFFSAPVLPAAPLPAAAAAFAPAVSAAATPVVPAASIPGLPSKLSAASGWNDGGIFFDGSEEREEEFAAAERREQKREEAKHAHAERPAFDFVRGRFDPDLARELAEAAVERPGGKDTNGYRLLALLVTPLAAHPDMPPDPARIDPAQFGRSDGEIRDLLAKNGIPRWEMDSLLEKAFRWGLVYRIHDAAREKTYYGVTQEARDLLHLKQPRGTSAKRAKAGKAEAPKASALGKGLIALAEEAMSLPARDELFEFSAQAAYAAAAAGLINKEALPAAFRARADAIGFEAARLDHALLTLIESSEGSSLDPRILALCEAAAAEGKLSRAELDEVLGSR